MKIYVIRLTKFALLLCVLAILENPLLGAEDEADRDNIAVFIRNDSSHDLFCVNPTIWNGERDSTFSYRFRNSLAGPIVFSKRNADLGCKMHINLAHPRQGLSISIFGCVTSVLKLLSVKKQSNASNVSTVGDKTPRLLADAFVDSASKGVRAFCHYKTVVASSLSALSGTILSHLVGKEGLEVDLNGMVLNCPHGKSILVSIGGSGVVKNFTLACEPQYISSPAAWMSRDRDGEIALGD